MFGRLFDERFATAVASSYGYTPIRLIMAAFLGAIAGFGVGWPKALMWMAAAALVEVGLFATSRPAVRSRCLEPAGIVAFSIANGIGVPVWSLVGVLLWTSPNPACHIAAAGFWAGHLLYIQVHQARSLGALLPCTSALITPIVTPLLIPQYQGMDQAVVMLIMAAVSGHSVISLLSHLIQARQLQDARLATEAASEAKSAFLARMSHEIRTPLNGVLGMTQAMAGEGDLSATHRERLGVIRQSGEALLTILNDILDLSKVEAGKLDLEVIPFDLVEVVDGVAAAFEPQAAAKGLGFRVAYEPDAAGRYRGDPTRVRQILYNLLGNALKFTAAGEIGVTLRRHEGRLVLAIWDTGIGIEPEHLARLFGRFHQAEISTHRRYGGAGLGLSICRELAELMGGAIEVASEPGAGSTFTVTLALERLGESESPGPAKGAAEPAARELRVLAAEDNAVNQLVLRTLLGQIDIDPLFVGDGAEAVAAWRDSDFDLILMDAQMPVMDGLAAMRAIREAEAASGRPRTPILALTANAMRHQVSEYEAAGADGHVAKPIDAASLYAAIDAAVAASSAEPSLGPDRRSAA